MIVMAKMRAVARAKKPTKVDKWNDDVLDMSITVGLRGVDVCRSDIHKLECLLEELHCIAGICALERGDTKNRVHFQMVYRAQVKYSLSFGIVATKYLGWYGVKDMIPAGRVVCKALTNTSLHTFCSMIGYCLKDTSS